MCLKQCWRRIKNICGLKIKWFLLVLIKPLIFGIFLRLVCPSQLEIKDTTDTIKSVSYLDLHLKIDTRGRLNTKFYDRREDVDCPIVNFPYLSGKIPEAPAYGVYISQPIRYSRACEILSDLQLKIGPGSWQISESVKGMLHLSFSHPS